MRITKPNSLNISFAEEKRFILQKSNNSSDLILLSYFKKHLELVVGTLSISYIDNIKRLRKIN